MGLNKALVIRTRQGRCYFSKFIPNACYPGLHAAGGGIPTGGASVDVIPQARGDVTYLLKCFDIAGVKVHVWRYSSDNTGTLNCG